MQKKETREKEQLLQGHTASGWRVRVRTFSPGALSAAAGGGGGHLDPCGLVSLYWVLWESAAWRGGWKGREFKALKDQLAAATAL